MSLNVRFVPSKEAMDKLSKLYPDFKPYYIEAMQALFQLSNDLEKAMEVHFARHGSSRSRYLILMVLYHCRETKMQPNEIAKQLNVTRGNMTSIIDGMIREELVTKTHDINDRRQVWIEPTAKAEAFLKKMLPDHFKRVAKLMSAVSKSEIESFIETSRKLHRSMSAFLDE